MDVRTVFPCDASSVAAARRLVQGQLASDSTVATRRSDHDDIVDAATLLLSELVTNAIVHARTNVEVHLVTDERMLRAEVTDGNPALPALRALPAPRHSAGLNGTGRGLQLIDDIASRWGVVSSADGKTVWFELTFAG